MVPETQGWRCCLPTADATTLSLSCRLERGAPWLAGRVLDVLRQLPGIRSDPDRQRQAVGTRRGAPLILAEPLLWEGLPLLAQAIEVGPQRAGEVTLHLPPWSELSAAISEGSLFAAVDQVAAEVSALVGVVSDGRGVGYPELTPPGPALRRLQALHLGVLVPARWLGLLRPGSTAYLELPRSRLMVVLE